MSTLLKVNSWFDCCEGVYVRGCHRVDPCRDLAKSGCLPSVCQVSIHLMYMLNGAVSASHIIKSPSCVKF